MAKSITVNVSIKELTDDFINKVNEIINQNADVQPRNCSLQFKVYDAEENIAVVLPAKKIKVNPNNELLNLLQTHKLDFKLN
jgi:DNA polymerase-3 subunit alpha